MGEEKMTLDVEELMTPEKFNSEIRKIERFGGSSTSHAMNMFETLYKKSVDIIAAAIIRRDSARKQLDEARRDAVEMAEIVNECVDKYVGVDDQKTSQWETAQQIIKKYPQE